MSLYALDPLDPELGRIWYAVCALRHVVQFSGTYLHVYGPRPPSRQARLMEEVNPNRSDHAVYCHSRPLGPLRSDASRHTHVQMTAGAFDLDSL